MNFIFQCKYVPNIAWGVLILNNYSLSRLKINFKWDWSLTGNPVFVFAKSDNPNSRAVNGDNGISQSCLRKGEGRAAVGSGGLGDLMSQQGAEGFSPRGGDWQSWGLDQKLDEKRAPLTFLVLHSPLNISSTPFSFPPHIGLNVNWKY